jgi:hypothetical protein
MKNVELEALKADLKGLSARVAALEKLLDRIVRQRPVSERQLKKALKSASLELDHLPVSLPPRKSNIDSDLQVRLWLIVSARWRQPSIQSRNIGGLLAGLQLGVDGRDQRHGQSPGRRYTGGLRRLNFLALRLDDPSLLKMIRRQSGNKATIIPRAKRRRTATISPINPLAPK